MPQMAKAPTRTPKPKADPAHAAAAVLIDHELQGLFAEAFEAYDMQDERLRIDTANRRWTFTPEKLNSQSVLRLQLKRLEDVREDTISTAVLASDLGRPMIEDVVRKLDASL